MEIMLAIALIALLLTATLLISDTAAQSGRNPDVLTVADIQARLELERAHAGTTHPLGRR
ncbi:hypothetical protein [Nocardia inohanensis]|uniref:hypothetical protein n=1 Tax=Nocardia inohanensis TaxID=209246 RepID=UPI000A569FFB|nr:hypothetical protein [Nocardia inohanensis]